MDRRDRKGRRRVEGQERGLRPLYPRLPETWLSRALRVSMPVASWSDFDTLVALFGREAQTGARAAGRALMTLFEASRYPARQPHWLDWEHHKALRLLRPIDRVA